MVLYYLSSHFGQRKSIDIGLAPGVNLSVMYDSAEAYTKNNMCYFCFHLVAGQSTCKAKAVDFEIYQETREPRPFIYSKRGRH